MGWWVGDWWGGGLVGWGVGGLVGWWVGGLVDWSDPGKNLVQTLSCRGEAGGSTYLTRILLHFPTRLTNTCLPRPQ